MTTSKLLRQEFELLKSRKVYHNWINDQMELQESTCYYCGDELCYEFRFEEIHPQTGELMENCFTIPEYEVDHKIPLSRGGTNDFKNLCITCHSCNKSKRTKTESEYLEFLNWIDSQGYVV